MKLNRRTTPEDHVKLHFDLTMCIVSANTQFALPLKIQFPGLVRRGGI